jgi:hypothetical protein
VLECRVYAKRKIGSDDFLGGTKETIESFLAEGAGTSGGMYISLRIPFDNSHILSVVTRELCQYDRHGNQRKSEIVIQFTIVAISKASTADTPELNMEEAVAQGKDALNLMKPAPSSFEPIQALLDTSTTVVDTVQSVSNIWGPFLQKLKLFTELVDAIAEVTSNELTWQYLNMNDQI